MSIPKLNMKWYKVSTWSIVSALILLILFRECIESLLKQYAGIESPNMWVDKGVIALVVFFFISMERWLRLESPNFVRRLKESATMDWSEFSYKLDIVTGGVQAVQVQVRDMDNRVTSDLLAVRADIGGLEGKLRSREETDRASQADKARLMTIRMNKITFVKKLSKELSEYATIKANSFIEFVMSLHATGFYVIEDTVRKNNPDMDFSRISDDITCEVSKLKKLGSELLPKTYLTIFFEKHETAVKEYTEQIQRIIEDKTNYKHRRFQETSEKFLSDFLETMHHSYIDYIKSGDE